MARSGLVDVVVVSYQSAGEIRACVLPLAGASDIEVTVVDNASTDGSLACVDDLPVRAVGLGENGGFARGCNVGWRTGSAPSVLFLNPDARIEPGSIERLIGAIGAHPSIAAVAPRLLDGTGGLAFSQRRFPRLRSTFGQALFLHRLLPKARWADEVERDASRYARPCSPEWVSGACLLVRRAVLEQLNGFDEGFFLYCEDADLCKRIRDRGYDIRFVPDAVCRHSGGASAPRSALLPVLAASRVRYARKHRRPLAARLEQLGVALGAASHFAVGRGGKAARVGHAASFRKALGRSQAGTRATTA